MFRVVQADAEDLGRLDRREQFAWLDNRIGELMVAKDISGNFERLAIRLQSGIGRTVG